MYPTIRYNCIFTKDYISIALKGEIPTKTMLFWLLCLFCGLKRTPGGAPWVFFIYVSIVHILLLNISQTRQVLRFSVNQLRKNKKTSEATNQTIFLIFAIFAHLTFYFKHAGPWVKMSKMSMKIVSFIP